MADIALNCVSNITHRSGQLEIGKLSKLHVNMNILFFLSQTLHLNWMKKYEKKKTDRTD